MGSPPLALSAAATALPLLLWLLGRADVAAADCRIPITQHSNPLPLLLRPEGPLTVSGFAAPDKYQVLHLRTNGVLRLACPGAGNYILQDGLTTQPRQVSTTRRPGPVVPDSRAFRASTPRKRQRFARSSNGQLRIRRTQEDVTCVRGTIVKRNGGEVDLRRVQCAKHAERTMEFERWQRCGAGGRGQRVRIGFRLLTGFMELVTSCFDEQLLSPIYSNYTLVQSIAGKQPGGGLSNFLTRKLFAPVSPDQQYNQSDHTLQNLLGRKLDDSINRGHLAPRAGFVFWPQMSATYFYVNAAPQWRSVNNGAWKKVEEAVRNLAAARGDLQVVTGVHGVTSLWNATGHRTPLHLFVEGTQRKMPVPALFWTVVWDERSREGAAVVANNNPWEPLSEHPELRLCANVCARLTWLTWLPTPPPDVYCCEVDALRKNMSDLPPLEVRGLLVSKAPPANGAVNRASSQPASQPRPQPVNGASSQSTAPPANQPANRISSQSTARPANQPANRISSQSTARPANHPVNRVSSQSTAPATSARYNWGQSFMRQGTRGRGRGGRKFG